jgi:membrane protease YdiL (CAAX protease family)
VPLGLIVMINPTRKQTPGHVWLRLALLCAMMLFAGRTSAEPVIEATAGDILAEFESQGMLLPTVIYVGLILAGVISSWILLAGRWMTRRSIFPPADLPSVEWKLKDVALVCCVFFLLLGAAALTIDVTQEMATFLAAHGLISLSLLLFILALARRRGQAYPDALGLDLRGLFEHLVPAVMVFFAFVPVIAGAGMLWSAFLSRYADGGFEVSQRLVQELLQTPSPQILFMIVISAVLVAPLWEEVLFRGLFYGALRRYVPAHTAIPAVGILFGLFHLPALTTIVPMSVLGMLLCYLYEKTGRLTVPIALHFLFNACQVGFMIVLRTW